MVASAPQLYAVVFRGPASARAAGEVQCLAVESQAVTRAIARAIKPGQHFTLTRRWLGIFVLGLCNLPRSSLPADGK